ncbi:MAG: 4-hydroxy-tetrahydrodipicolinate synthase [Cellvibrionaceae bacterium]
MIQGSMVALVTPMHSDGSLDWQALDSLIEWHVEQGTNAIVAMGTTGESATLSVDEHLQVVERVVKQVNKRIAVIAGTGANSTSEAVALTQAAHDLGVDACLLVVPYYNKPTQEGLYQHFLTVANSVEVPQILYNVPGRTITDMSNETALRLATHKNIIAIKDATGDISRGKDLIDQVPAGFSVFSGDDLTAVELMLLGGKGNISVTANVVPKQMADLCRSAIAGQPQEARAIQEQLLPLHNALFIESNPIPVKWAVAKMGLMPDGIRLPLTPLTDVNSEPLEKAMASLSLLSV